MTDTTVCRLPARSFSRLFRASPPNLADLVAFLMIAAAAVLIVRGLADDDGRFSLDDPA